MISQRKIVEHSGIDEGLVCDFVTPEFTKARDDTIKFNIKFLKGMLTFNRAQDILRCGTEGSIEQYLVKTNDPKRDKAHRNVFEAREAKRMAELVEQDGLNAAAARAILEEQELEMAEWNAIIEEEELGVQVGEILNEGDSLETLMFGCSHCSSGECVWLVKRLEVKKNVLDLLPNVSTVHALEDLNKRRRFASYRIMARAISGVGNQRVKLPECVVVGIRTTFPEPTGIYATPL